MAMMADHRAQHSTTAYSSCLGKGDRINQENRGDLQKGHGGEDGGEDVDGVGDVDETCSCILQGWPGLQVGGVNVQEEDPQDHLHRRGGIKCVSLVSPYSIQGKRSFSWYTWACFQNKSFLHCKGCSKW